MNPKTDWRRFVEHRRIELRNEFPCATPTARQRCPKHQLTVPQETVIERGPNRGRRIRLSGVCVRCRSELYEQLAAEFVTSGSQSAEPLEESLPATGQMDIYEVLDLVEPGREEQIMDNTELVEFEPEIVEVDAATPAPLTLFGTRDPRIALERMADVATALVDVIDSRKLFVTISGRKHITVEGWTTLGGMLGVVPIVTGTRTNDTGDGIVATVEARTLAGAIVGAAEAECSRAESKWRNRDPYAIRSMAQTRAISRALRAPLGQIIVLAGYETTPAEEMPADDTGSRTPVPVQVNAEQLAEIGRLISRLTKLRPDTDWKQRAREIVGCQPKQMTVAVADGLIGRLRQSVETTEEFDARESPEA